MPIKKKPKSKAKTTKRKRPAAKKATARKRQPKLARTAKPRVKASYRPRLSSLGIGEVRMPRAGSKAYEIWRVK